MFSEFRQNFFLISLNLSNYFQNVFRTFSKLGEICLHNPCFFTLLPWYVKCMFLHFNIFTIHLVTVLPTSQLSRALYTAVNVVESNVPCISINRVRTNCFSCILHSIFVTSECSAVSIDFPPLIGMLGSL